VRRAGGYAWRWLRHGASAGNQKSSSAPGSPAPARGAGEWAGSDDVTTLIANSMLRSPPPAPPQCARRMRRLCLYPAQLLPAVAVAASSSGASPPPPPVPRNEKRIAPSQPLTDAPFMYRYRILYGSWTGNHNLSTAPGAAHGPLPSRHSRARLNNRKYRILTRETA